MEQEIKKTVKATLLRLKNRQSIIENKKKTATDNASQPNCLLKKKLCSEKECIVTNPAPERASADKKRIQSIEKKL